MSQALYGSPEVAINKIQGGEETAGTLPGWSPGLAAVGGT